MKRLCLVSKIIIIYQLEHFLFYFLLSFFGHEITLLSLWKVKERTCRKNTQYFSKKNVDQKKRKTNQGHSRLFFKTSEKTKKWMGVKKREKDKKIIQEEKIKEKKTISTRNKIIPTSEYNLIF